MSEDDPERSYSDAEVEAIFRRALERQQARGDGFGHGELVAAAKEVGLDEASIARAVQEIERERAEEDLRRAVRKRQIDKWLRHLSTYLVIAGGFLGMHVLGLVGAWAIWMAFGWGMGLALHTFDAVRGPSEAAVEKERRRRHRKERVAAQARARREAKRRRAERRAERRRGGRRRRDASDELERAIEDGVTLLLGAAARKLREASAKKPEPAQPQPPQGDFARYVEEQKRIDRGILPQSGAKGPVTARPIRTRVAPDEDTLAEEEEEQEAERAPEAKRRRRW